MRNLMHTKEKEKQQERKRLNAYHTLENELDAFHRSGKTPTKTTPTTTKKVCLTQMSKRTPVNTYELS